MKRGKPKSGFRSVFMGICFSIEQDDQQSPRQLQQSSKMNSSGDEFNQSPSRLSGQASIATKSTNGSPIPKNIGGLSKFSESSNLDIFKYEELKLATKNFYRDFVLGHGGFGTVYKGIIDGDIRPGYAVTEVAIKKLNRDGLQGDREWQAEVNYLGQLSHPNLVKLIGHCCEDEHRLLVYEYMQSGSLEKHLFGSIRFMPPLSWMQRVRIALDAAQGLSFLHDADRCIIYRDFKTSNILLDDKFRAKLSDFGLAKDGPMGDQTHVSTRVMGTYGYAAPEYVMTGRLTARSDVYGFGVVLLELLIGKRALDKRRPGREQNLVEWVRPILNNSKKLARIIDPAIEQDWSNKTSVERVAKLAHSCLSLNPKNRPLMSEVVLLLRHAMQLAQTRPQLATPGENNVAAPPATPGLSLGREGPAKIEPEAHQEHGTHRRRKTMPIGGSRSECSIQV